MFGNLTMDEIIKHVRNGGGFEIPFSGQGLSTDVHNGKVNKRVGVADFLKAAKKRFIKQNPIAPNQADYVNWILYDRVSFAASAVVGQLTRLFVTPIGGGAKTKVDTNLEQVSTLPSPQWFNATGLSIFFNNNVAPIDLSNFLATEYLEFWVSSKVYVEGPLDCFPGSGGVFGSGTVSNLTAGATAYAVNSANGWPSIGNMFDLRLPQGLPLGNDSSGASLIADGIIGVTILQSQTFNLQFKADGGGATMATAQATPYAGVGLTLNARISGILSRGVQ